MDAGEFKTERSYLLFMTSWLSWKSAVPKLRNESPQFNAVQLCEKFSVKMLPYDMIF